MMIRTEMQKGFTAVVLVLVVVLTTATSGFTCCWFKSQYADMYSVVSVGQGYECPSIEDWGSARKTWFVAVPTDCYAGPPNNTETYTTRTPPAAISALRKKGESALANGGVGWSSSSSNNPVHCCFYSKPVYYMTQPIQTVSPNPASGQECQTSYEGLTLGGEWYTGAPFLSQACFFETFTAQ